MQNRKGIPNKFLESTSGVLLSKDNLTDSIVMIVFCIGMTRSGFENFRISVFNLIMISFLLFIFMGQRKIKTYKYGKGLIPIAVFNFLIIPIQILINDGYYNTVAALKSAILYASMVVAIVLLTDKENCKLLWKILNSFTLTGSILIIIQELFYLNGIRLDLAPGMNNTIFRGFYFQFYRPCGMFSEPSHFAEMGLLSAFYYLFIERKMIKFLVVAVALMLSTSALGIVGVLLIILLYFISIVFSTAIGQAKKILFAILMLAGSLFFFAWFFSTDNPVILRVLNGATSATRINRSFELYQVLDPMHKIFGIGSQNQTYFLNSHKIILPSDTAATIANREFAQTFGYLLCTTGIIGSILFWFPFGKLFLRSNYKIKTLVVLFVYICLTACIQGRPTMLVYMILIFSTYNAEQRSNIEYNENVTPKT